VTCSTEGSLGCNLRAHEVAIGSHSSDAGGDAISGRTSGMHRHAWRRDDRDDEPSDGYAQGLRRGSPSAADGAGAGSSSPAPIFHAWPRRPDTAAARDESDGTSSDLNRHRHEPALGGRLHPQMFAQGAVIEIAWSSRAEVTAMARMVTLLELVNMVAEYSSSDAGPLASAVLRVSRVASFRRGRVGRATALQRGNQRRESGSRPSSGGQPPAGASTVAYSSHRRLEYALNGCIEGGVEFRIG
jgi:hypothetical protein